MIRSRSQISGGALFLLKWASWGIPLIGDLDGDSAGEMVIWRPGTGRWYGLNVDGSRVFPKGSEPQYGIRGDLPTVGDMSDDGIDDLIIWRPSSARWYAKTPADVGLVSGEVWGVPY